MAVEIWNERTRNAVDEFETEEEALAFVHAMINRHGERSLAAWAMDVADDTPMVRGSELIARALAVPV
jgi:hypothetical protein